MTVLVRAVRLIDGVAATPHGRVDVRIDVAGTSPTDTEVVVDGSKRSEASVQLNPGWHVVVVRSLGREQSRTLALQEGERAEVRFDFSVRTGTAAANLVRDPPCAGRPRGRIPWHAQ